jgi:hypothetical protein
MFGEFDHEGKLYEIKRSFDPPESNDYPCKFNTFADVKGFFTFVMADPLSRKEILQITKFFLPYADRAGKSRQLIEEERLNQLCKEILDGDLRVVQKRIVTMTQEQKKQCARLFKIFTEIDTEPERWNEKAADILADMINEIKRCSEGMAFLDAMIPKRPPVGPTPWKPTWRWWLCNFILNFLKNEDKIRRGFVYVPCHDALVLQYRKLIIEKLMGI